uniref:Uncharacterized protein n=1 Tax=Solanum tuberosum TaxID=4113 RepID=M1A8L8_SOLTU
MPRLHFKTLFTKERLLCFEWKWQAWYGSLIHRQTGGTHYTQLDYRPVNLS